MRKLIAIAFRLLFSIDYLKPHYFGLHKRIFGPLNLFKGVSFEILYRNNIKMVVHISDWIQQNLYFLNEYEEKEIRFLEKFLQKGDTFIDVGANIGLFSLVASKQIGETGKVFAFEPIQKNFNHLIQHIQLNNLTNIQYEKLAVSNKQGEIELYLNEQDSDSGTATAFAEVFTSAERAITIPLDDYFVGKESVIVKLIKMDIEGGEYLALQGMSKLLKRDKPTLLIEINEDAPYDKTLLYSLLQNIGYCMAYLDQNGDLINEKLEEDNSNNFLFICS